MRVFSAADLAKVLDYGALIDRIDEFFRIGCTAPVRHHHHIDVPNEDGTTLLLMPAWREGDFVGVKIVTIFPGNLTRSLPSVMGTYLILSGKTGQPLASMDGKELTVRRTGAASALASRYLSRPDSRHLLMVGTGSLAPHMIRSHAAARPIDRVTIWGRTPDHADALAKSLTGDSFSVSVTRDLEAGVRAADIISCATLAVQPLVFGRWLKAGQHVDLVGGYRTDMRETDDDAIAKVSLYVDTRDGALKEGGDLTIPIAAGVITAAAVKGDLFDLARGTVAGRQRADDITLFKSVGTAVEDLAAAALAAERLGAQVT